MAKFNPKVGLAIFIIGNICGLAIGFWQL